MIARNVTQSQMEAALSTINKKYHGNIAWKRFEPKGKGLNFTLTVNRSTDAGGRISHMGRRICAACWHAHGDFFDALFEVAPEAVIRSMGRKITKNEGNWQDRNIGSMMYPMMYSEACDCRRIE